MKKKSSRIVYLDILNIVAIVSVLLMHHNGNVHTFSTDRGWLTSLVVECVCYFAVPLFLMISGATLLGYKEKYDTKTFFKKRALKVFIPAIAWMLIMFVWHTLIVRDLVIESWSPAYLINVFMTSGECSIYYYLFIIMGLYLTIPLITPLAEKKNRNSLWYGVGVFFIFNTLLPDLLALAGVHWNTSFSLQIGGYVIYLFLGYLLSTAKISKKRAYLLYVGAILAIVYRYAMTAIMSHQLGDVDRTTWGYTTFHTMILASAVFVFVKRLPLDKISAKVGGVLARLAGCSFGIYLAHLIIMHYELMALRAMFGMEATSWVYRFVCPFLTYAISVLVVMALKKIPLIKKIVP